MLFAKPVIWFSMWLDYHDFRERFERLLQLWSRGGILWLSQDNRNRLCIPRPNSPNSARIYDKDFEVFRKSPSGWHLLYRVIDSNIKPSEWQTTCSWTLASWKDEELYVPARHFHRPTSVELADGGSAAPLLHSVSTRNWCNAASIFTPSYACPVPAKSTIAISVCGWSKLNGKYGKTRLVSGKAFRVEMLVEYWYWDRLQYTCKVTISPSRECQCWFYSNLLRREQMGRGQHKTQNPPSLSTKPSLYLGFGSWSKLH